MVAGSRSPWPYALVDDAPVVVQGDGRLREDGTTILNRVRRPSSSCICGECGERIRTVRLTRSRGGRGPNRPTWYQGRSTDHPSPASTTSRAATRRRSVWCPGDRRGGVLLDATQRGTAAHRRSRRPLSSASSICCPPSSPPSCRNSVTTKVSIRRPMLNNVVLTQLLLLGYTWRLPCKGTPLPSNPMVVIVD